MGGGKTLVHAKQVRRKQRCLIPAGTGANLKNSVTAVIAVTRQQQHLKLVFLLGQLPGEGADLFLRKGDCIVIITGLIEHGSGISQINTH